MKSINTAISIYGQLKTFGLDWREWIIGETRKDQIVLLKHRADPRFQLKGRIRARADGRCHLHSLSLLSV
jgi:hypothetical protein